MIQLDVSCQRMILFNVKGIFFRFQILDQFKPIIIFSAHTHLSRILTYPPQEVESVYDNRIVKVHLHSDGMGDSRKYTEIMIPTSSYRMGVPNVGFGFAVIGKYICLLYFYPFGISDGI